MGIMDLFKAKENERLQIEIADLKSKLSPEHNKIQELIKQIKDMNLDKNNLKNEIQRLTTEKARLEKETDEKN